MPVGKIKKLVQERFGSSRRREGDVFPSQLGQSAV